MAYTTAQLVTAYTNANLGKGPDAATTLAIDAFAAQSQDGRLTDTVALANTLKLVSNTTAVAIESYQFFTGRAPSAAGLAYLINSTTNTNDLNDASYSKFGQENRFINFAINLATGTGEGAAAFAASYGSVSYAQAVATAYDKIIGNTVAAGAGIDVAAAVAYLSRTDNITYLTAFVKANTKLTAAADIDLAVKAALVGEILNAATSAGLGSYAKATSAMILDLSDGTLNTDNAAGVNIFTAYGDGPLAVSLTSGNDTLSGNKFDASQVYTPGGNDRINSLQDEDKLTGTGANPTLSVTLGNTNDNGSKIITPTLTGIETINAVFSNTDGTGLDLQDATGLKVLNVTRVSSALANGTVGSTTAAAVNLLNLPATALNLAISNSVAYSDVNISYRDGELNGAETVTVALSSAAIEDLVIGSQALQTNHINNLVLDIKSASQVQNLNLKGGSVETADQTLSIVAGATFILGDDANKNGNYLDDNSALAGVDSRLAKITVTGAGNVTIGEISTRSKGMILDAGAATGDIAVNVTRNDQNKDSAFTTGSGNDTIVSDGLAADLTTGLGNDTVTVAGSITADSLVDLGDGADKLTVGTAGTQNGVAIFTGALEGTIAGGTTVNTGAGDDIIVIGDVSNVSLGEEAVLNTGDGNDSVTLSGSITGDTIGAADGDNLTAEVNLGAGDDTLTFNLLGQGDQGVLIAGLVTGGAGANVINVTGNANATVTVQDTTDADRVTGVQTLNLTSAQAISAALATAINTVKAGTVTQNDNNAVTADYTVDVSEFTGLTTINVRNEAGVTDATPEEATAIRRFAGDDATTTLTNLQGGEAINVATVEAGTGVESDRTIGGIDGRIVGSTELANDQAADLTLNLSLDKAATDQVARVVIGQIGIAGQIDGDVAINDVGAWSNTPAASDANKELKDLNLTINGSTNRTITLAAGDFRNTLTLASNAAAGTTFTFTGVEATTIAAGSVAANLNITVLTSEGKTITTGAGNDVVNLLNDVLDSSNTTAAASRDVIDLGAGFNKIIVNDELRGAGLDTDEVFDNVKNVQEVEVRLGTTIATLDDDAFNAGINTFTVGSSGQFVDLDIGVDFTRALTVNLVAGASVDIDNDADQNLTVNIGSQGATTDALLAFTDAGTGSTNVTVNITVDSKAQNISDGALASINTNDVFITNADATGEIDKIVLKDSVQTSTVAGAAQTVTGNIALKLGAAWAQASDTLTVDASDINDDDKDANADGDRADNGSDFADAPRGDIGYLNGSTAEVGNDIDDTQTMSIDASAANYKVNIIASQLADTIIGTKLADVIDGQAGADKITGGAGSDTLTGGAGADTFIYTSVSDSDGNTTSTDTITDFTTGSDKLDINLGTNSTTGIVNFGSFASVASSGDGDNSLQGTTGTTVVGDAFYDAGAKKFIVDADGDGDITTTNDLQINSTGAVNAADVNYTITANNAAGVVVRGGQGADTITTGNGNDTFVVVGTLSATDVTNYVTAGSAAAVGIDATIAKVLSYTELTATNGSATEARSGETLAGGAGNDNLHLFGTVNLTGTTITNIETVTVHSTVILTVSQLYSINNLVLSGDEPHTITVVQDNGASLSAPQQKAVLSAIPGGITVVGAGANTSVTVAGSTVYAVGATPNGNITGAVTSGAASPPTGIGSFIYTGTDTGASDGITNDTTPSYSGTASNNAKVTVYIDADNDGIYDVGEAVQTVTADGSGNWSVSNLGPAVDGVVRARAFVTDASGLRSVTSSNLNATVDTIAPTAPTIALTTDTGSSSSDGITNSTGVTVSGLEGGASWQYSLNGGTTWNNGSGSTFSLGVNTTYSAGQILVRQTDGAGNTSGNGSNGATWVQDSTNPTAPTFAITPDTGSSNSDNVSQSTTVTVSGLETGASWQYSTDSGASWTTGSGTTFSLAANTTYGANQIHVKQTDVAGNVSTDAVNAGVFQTDTTPPAAPTFALASDTGASNSDNVTNANAMTVSGIEAGATWEYSLNNGSTWTAGSGSSFNIADNTSYGIGQIRVRQTDKAGNLGVDGVNTTVVIEDSSNPATPTLALTLDTGSSSSDGVTYNNAVTVSGLEGGTTTWEYSLNNGTTWNTGSGISFLLTSDTTFAAGTVKVRQTDLAGNVSSVGSNAGTWVEDSTNPGALTFALANDTGVLSNDNVTNANAVNITGLETGATWQYSLNGGTTWTTGTGTSFNLVDNTSYTAGQIVVKQTDVAGNVGTTTANAGTIVEDSTAPVWTGLSASGGTDVVTITFNEAIGTFDVNQLTFYHNGVASTFSGLAIVGNTITFNSGVDLTAATSTIDIAFGAGFVTDVAGNQVALVGVGAAPNGTVVGA